MKDDISIFWFRRDLRLPDNAGLYHALCSGKPVLPVFIFDTDILDDLSDKTDRRLQFIHDCLTKLQGDVTQYGSSMCVLHGTPADCIKKLTGQYSISAIYTNHDYEPYAIKRDNEIKDLLQELGISFYTYKDQVIFERNEVLKDNNEPYTVFTPYSKKWKTKLSEQHLKQYPSEGLLQHLLQQLPLPIPTLRDIGFIETNISIPEAKPDDNIISHYNETRDYPAIKGTTQLSVHLRFGTISIRQLAAKALQLNETYLNELIWREFYMMILWHFPGVVTESFKKEYDNIAWRSNEQELELWKLGMTGYPIVDAGMRQLNATGYMHNRLRMITASFLTKHLLIDWRLGEAYFATKLMDYDLSANNGGWQWAAGTGCDAAPYFRIFNPYIQTKKFDPELKYIRHWVPELDTLYYPQPIVQHELARKRCLEVYQIGLGK